MDKQILAELARVLEPDLPDAAENIKRLSGDQTLYDMCMEYQECTESLRHWTNAPAEHEDRINEYTELLTDLQQEILQYLQEHKS